MLKCECKWCQVYEGCPKYAMTKAIKEYLFYRDNTTEVILNTEWHKLEEGLRKAVMEEFKNE